MNQKIVPLFLLLCSLSISTWGKTQPFRESSKFDQSPAVGPGVVVETARRRLEPDDADFEAGDILLRWERGTDQRAIESPLDLEDIEMEKGGVGNGETVLIEGLRGNQKHVWVLNPKGRYLETRPNFSGTFLPYYLHCETLRKSGEIIPATECFQKAAMITQDSSPPWLFSWLLYRAADALTKKRKLQRAELLYHSIRQRADAVSGDAKIQLLRLSGKGFWGVGKLQMGKDCAEEALRESIRLGTNKLRDLYLQLSVLAYTYEMGDLDATQSILQQMHSSLTATAPATVFEAAWLQYAGNIAFRRGDLDEAEQHYVKAFAIRDKISDKTLGFSINIEGLGLIALKRGDLTKAERYFRSSLEIREKLGAPEYFMAYTFNNLSSVAMKQQDFYRAGAYAHRALSEWKKAGGRRYQEADALATLGQIAELHGELIQAAHFFDDAVAIEHKLAHSDRALTYALEGLGDIAKDRGNLGRAELLYRDALATEKKMTASSIEVGVILQKMGDVALAFNNIPKAEECYNQALAIAKTLAPGSIKHAESLAGLASILRLKGQPGSAAQMYEQSLDALEHQATHIGGADEIRSNFRARHEDYYNDYINLLLEQHEPERAFEILERSRARTLIETLVQANVDVRKGADPELVTKERSLQQALDFKTDARIRLLTRQPTDEQITKVEKEIADLLAQLQDIESRIRTSSPSYAALTQPKPLSVAAVRQQLLDSDTVLLEYSLGKEHSHVWAVTQESVTVYELPKRIEIDSAARRVYGLLTVHNHVISGEPIAQRKIRLSKAQAEFDRASVHLSQMILGPVADQIVGKRLLVVSDGALQYIPFGALLVPQSAANGKEGTPLITEHEIVNLPSASVLAVLRQEATGRTQATKSVAVLADPVFTANDVRVGLPQSRAPVRTIADDHPFNSRLSASRAALRSQDLPALDDTTLATDLLTRSVSDVGLHGRSAFSLPRLPFSRHEADSIVAADPANDALEAIDFNASRATAMSPDLAQYRIVHFATHGLLDSQHPELSGLVFSMVDQQGKPQNGFLELQDIYNLNLPADLVVLSACETGLGKEIDGEGLVGLTRGFMYAGASRVVASLWKVDDAATAELMSHFYTAMLHDGLSAASALRKAQMDMAQQPRWSDPYYWAAFQLQGEWK